MAAVLNKKLFDFHVHIGQFEDVYYSPHKIVETLVSCGVGGAYISSTTSCIRFSNDTEKRIVVEHIQDEFRELMDSAKDNLFDARPLCWVIPERYLEGESVVQMMSESLYAGFKIHPRAHEWNLADSKICALMDDICDYSETNSVPILIHTGTIDYERPAKFERWFKMFPMVKFILAHCKAEDEVIDLMRRYRNVFGDTAFCSKQSFQTIMENGFARRMLWGTDFPIVDFFEGKRKNDLRSLKGVYRKLIKSWRDTL